MEDYARLKAESGIRYENTPPHHDKYRGIMNVIVYESGVANGDVIPGTGIPVMIRQGRGISMRHYPSASTTEFPPRPAMICWGERPSSATTTISRPALVWLTDQRTCGRFEPVRHVLCAGIVEGAFRSIAQCGRPIAVYGRFRGPELEPERSVSK
jgi:hypothetical protein